jgi:hypothetical protein
MEFYPSVAGLNCYDFIMRIKCREEKEVVKVIVVTSVDQLQRNFTKRKIKLENKQEDCMQ